MKEDIAFQIIANAIESKEVRDDDILPIFTAIGVLKDIILIKNDGLRSDNNFTAVILSGNSKFEAIRHDDSSVNLALSNVLKYYFKIMKSNYL